MIVQLVYFMLLIECLPRYQQNCHHSGLQIALMLLNKESHLNLIISLKLNFK
jgi:hypothetical protein